MQFRRMAWMRSPTLLGAALLVACSSPAPTPATGAVPLADAVPTLDPRPVWQHFEALTQVPRPSHHEARATAFVAEFGRRVGLETIVDAAGNVVIRKPATPGREGRAGVVLQAHLDMVPQSSDPAFDFETQPIQAFVEDGWVFAHGTTLGADDGIGVAMVMALLGATDVEHGPIEALFTTAEEDGMVGMNGLAGDALRGRLYVNVDNEVEGSFVISSSGGVDIDVHETFEQVATPSGATGFAVSIGGLMGGHSGIDIDKGRGSAHQLMARLVVNAPGALGLRVASVAGGDMYNVIPSNAIAVVAVPTVEAEAFLDYVSAFATDVKAELAATDGAVSVTATPTDLPPKVMETAAQGAIFGAILAAPQGVQKMSTAVPGLVETSCNLGVLAIRDGEFTGGALARSAVDPERDALAQSFVDVFERAGATAELHDRYASWPPNPSSPLLALMKEVFTTLTGVAPDVTAIHAGLETSLALSKFTGMDMISVGPTVRNVHSPDERLEVATVPRVYRLLVATLAAIE